MIAPTAFFLWFLISPFSVQPVARV